MLKVNDDSKMIERIFKTNYFTWCELCCKCGCNRFHGNEYFLEKFLLFRVIYDRPFTPTSVYRCKKHKDYSTNHDGWAADVPYRENDSTQRFEIVYAAIKAGFKRIGIAKNFIHIDCNPEYDGTNLEEVIWLYE